MNFKEKILNTWSIQLPDRALTGKLIDLDPVEQLVLKYVRVTNFKNKAEMVDALLRFSLGRDMSMLQHFKPEFNSLPPHIQDSYRKIIIQLYDTMNNNIGMPFNLLNSDLVIGLMRENNKSFDQYIQSSDTITLSSLGFTDSTLINLPQYLSTGVGSINDTINRVLSESNIKKITEMAAMVPDGNLLLEITTCLSKSKSLVQALELLATNSTKFSNVTTEGVAPIVLPGTVDPGLMEVTQFAIQQLQQSLHNKIIKNLRVHPQMAADFSMSITNMIAQTQNPILINNVILLLDRKDSGLYLEDYQNILMGQNLALAYMSPNISPDYNREVIDNFMEIMIPLCYIAAVFRVPLSGIVSFDIFQQTPEFVNGDPSVGMVFNNPEILNMGNLTPCFRVDFQTHRGISTNIFGVLNKQPLLKSVSRNLIPKLSTEFVTSFGNGMVQRTNIDTMMKKLFVQYESSPLMDNIVDIIASMLGM